MSFCDRYPLFRYRIQKINPLTNQIVVRKTSKRSVLFDCGIDSRFHRDWVYVCSAYRFEPHSRFTASIVTYFTDRPFVYDHRTDAVRNRYSPRPTPLIYYLTNQQLG